VSFIIFKKSLFAPLRKCGILSDTTDISRLGILIALSIKIARIEKVFDADVPPCITLIRDFIFLIFLKALV
jgi:hypothetical protein